MTANSGKLFHFQEIVMPDPNTPPPGAAPKGGNQPRSTSAAKPAPTETSEGFDAQAAVDAVRAEINEKVDSLRAELGSFREQCAAAFDAFGEDLRGLMKGGPGPAPAPGDKTRLKPEAPRFRPKVEGFTSVVVERRVHVDPQYIGGYEDTSGASVELKVNEALALAPGVAQTLITMAYVRAA